MRTTIWLFLVSVLPLYCVAQQDPSDNCMTIIEGSNRVTVAMNQLRSELNSENAQLYASVFDYGATWDGPLGQNALGPENIQRAAHLLFRTVGPLQCVLWVQRQISADTWIVDMYQKVTNAHSSSSRDIPTVRGSVAPAYASDIRTTFVLRGKDTGWTVVAARIADLRLSKATDAVSARFAKPS